MHTSTTTPILRCLILLILSVAATHVAAQPAASLTVSEHQLSNGMTVWLNEDHSLPVVYGAVVVKAGSKDCPGTGIAHYFEHIMFKGTDRIGTVDYPSEKVYLDSIAALYDQLSQTSDESGRSKLQQDINRISVAAARYAIPNEFNRLITRYGGSELNAATSYDMTFYYNTFPAQYIEQWSLLYSERLLHPVFRLFQGELETVYEEKNRGEDNIMSSALEQVMKAIFQDQPYGYPIIGTTENLKNPRMSEMEAFFKRYYVGCNMGIVLAGDIDPAATLPLLERTFGRIDRGTPPARTSSPLPDIHGNPEVSVKAPIPILSVQANLYKAPTDYESDAQALDIGLRLLSNGSSGLLDSLCNESKLLAAVAMRIAMNDAGVTGYLVVPKLLSSSKKAIANVEEQVARIQRGDFSDEMFQAAKLDAIRKAEMSIETPDNRAEQMIAVMASGHTWQEYLRLVEDYRHVTRDQVMRALSRYLSGNHYLLRKKYGTPKKDQLKQPGYKPVKPQHVDEQSSFAQELASVATAPQAPRAVDFSSDATVTPLGSHATLYTVNNPVNDLFEFELRYARGQRHDPVLEALEIYLGKIDTDSLTRQQWQRSLYVLGVTSEIQCSKNSFRFTLNGPDTSFTAALHLLGHLLTHAKHNAKALDDVVDEAKLTEKSFEKDNSDVMRAVLEKVMYGTSSSYLQRVTKQQAKALNGEQMLAKLSDLLTTECTLFYSGTLSADEVGTAVRTALPIDRATKHSAPVIPDCQAVDEPTVYVYNLPNARQTYLCTYETVRPQSTLRGKVCFDVLNEYIGGGMSSILFQEIREFRSMAYNTQSVDFYAPHNLYPDRRMALCTLTSTQADKSMQATALLDSLLRDLPVRKTNYEVAREGYISQYRNDYPSFREMGQYIYNSRLTGYDSDPAPQHMSLAASISLDDMLQYYRSEVAGNSNHRCLMLIGNVKKMDMKQLEKMGRVVMLKKESVFRK